MYTVQDYSVLYNYTVHLVICKDLLFSHTWKSLVWLHHFINGGIFGPIKLVYPRHVLLKCLYQDRKMKGSCICGIDISISLIFAIFVLFRQWGIFIFYFITNMYSWPFYRT